MILTRLFKTDAFHHKRAEIAYKKIIFYV